MGLLAYAFSSMDKSLQLNSAPFYFLLFFSLPLALLLDVFLAVILGNTPAKIVIGVKPTTSRGERLSLAAHLRRNIGVWTDGIALGLIPISLFTMFKQYKRISGRRETIYDERLHARMRSGKYCSVRAFLAIPVFVAIAYLIVLAFW